MYKPENEMYVKIIADSINPAGKRIVTFHAHYPRIIHGEVMTHRVFSRNARSSRAVPVKTIIQEVIDKPFIPWHWGKNQKGMQATEECDATMDLPVYTLFEGDRDATLVVENYTHNREEAWLWARDKALVAAKGFMNAGYHKQVINRILEPYSWIDTLITTTNLSNFYHLRDHEDAEPHFHDLAKMIRNEVNNSTPKLLLSGQWHMPYVHTEFDDNGDQSFAYNDGEKLIYINEDTAKKISVARCARISYAPFDGDGSIDREIERYNLLVGSEPLHASPAEHQACVDHGDNRNSKLSGNLGPGYIQYRKTLPNEFFNGVW